MIVNVENIIVFLRSLSDPRLRAKVFRGIDLLANHWPLIAEPHVKPVAGSDGLWELREQMGNIRIRLFFFQLSKDKLVMIHGYSEKTQKIPKRELETAERKMQEIRRGGR